MSDPLVSVVIATRDRPALVRKALESFFTQDLSDDIEIIVVFDQSEPDQTLASCHSGREVRVLSNTRTPGLAGARNSGILTARAPWVAFCDDDDWWKPSRLSRQLAAAHRASQDVHLVTCSIEVRYGDSRTERLAGRDRVTHGQLLRSRMAMLHSSTFLFRRASLLGPVGLVSEEAPGSQNEDWDLLLRTSELGPIVHVDEPLVIVHWGSASFFARTWATKAESLHWMLAQHPAILKDRRAAARVFGQIAFAEASQGHGAETRTWAGKALGRDPFQWRAAVALAVSTGLISSESVLDLLHRIGRGV